MNLSRKDVLVAAAAAAVFPACGSSELPPPRGDPAPTDTDPNGGGTGDGTTAGAGGMCAQNLKLGGPVTISSNHGHTVSIPKADIDAGVTRQYSIRGTSGHDHVITVEAAHFATLKQGGAVTVTSSSTGHVHDVTLECGN